MNDRSQYKYQSIFEALEIHDDFFHEKGTDIHINKPVHLFNFNGIKNEINYGNTPSNLIGKVQKLIGPGNEEKESISESEEDNDGKDDDESEEEDENEDDDESESGEDTDEDNNRGNESETSTSTSSTISVEILDGEINGIENFESFTKEDNGSKAGNNTANDSTNKSKNNFKNKNDENETADLNRSVKFERINKLDNLMDKIINEPIKLEVPVKGLFKRKFTNGINKKIGIENTTTNDNISKRKFTKENKKAKDERGKSKNALKFDFDIIDKIINFDEEKREINDKFIDEEEEIESEREFQINKKLEELKCQNIGIDVNLFLLDKNDIMEYQQNDKYLNLIIKSLNGKLLSKEEFNSLPFSI